MMTGALIDSPWLGLAAIGFVLFVLSCIVIGGDREASHLDGYEPRSHVTLVPRPEREEPRIFDWAQEDASWRLWNCTYSDEGES